MHTKAIIYVSRGWVNFRNWSVWEGGNNLPGLRKGLPGGLRGSENLYRLTIK